MPESDPLFSDLIGRVRAGDSSAAAELVRQFEPEIRLKIRTWLRMRNPALRRAFDSMDICQSVMGGFFLRVSAGQYDLENPGQLLGLLTVMARNKLSEQVRRQQADRRDIRRNEAIVEGTPLAQRGETPSQLISGQELLHEFRIRLSDDERQIADARAKGQAWEAIATVLGGTAEARRKQWSRAVDRVARELGMASDGEDLEP